MLCDRSSVNSREGEGHFTTKSTEGEVTTDGTDGTDFLQKDADEKWGNGLSRERARGWTKTVLGTEKVQRTVGKLDC